MADHQAADGQPDNQPMTDALTEEVQNLTFALLDERIEGEQLKRLEELLTGDAQAREIYLTCVQMHVDLREILSSGVAAPSQPAVSRVPSFGLPISLPAPGVNTPLDQA